MTRMSGQEQNEKFPVDPYAGGRFSNAVRDNPNLNSLEKLLLLVIVGDLDFRNLSQSRRYISREKLVKWTSLSISKVKQLTTSLSEHGYLIKKECFTPAGKQQNNEYGVGPRLFNEYIKLCQNSSNDALPDGVTEAPYRPEHDLVGGHDMAPNLPHKELPQEENKISKDILSKDGDADASPHINQNDISNCSQEQEKTKNVTKRCKSNSKRSKPSVDKKHAFAKFRAVYTRTIQPHEHPTKFIKFVSHEDKKMLFDELWKLYPDKMIYERLYEEFRKRDAIGAAEWNHNRIYKEVEWAAQIINEEKNK